MTRPEQPKPNYRGKATQTITTPHGHSFEMCINSDECDVTDELSEASKNLHEMFDLMAEIFSPNKTK
jgi:hypothetical protein